MMPGPAYTLALGGPEPLGGPKIFGGTSDPLAYHVVVENHGHLLECAKLVKSNEAKSRKSPKTRF